MGMGKVVGPRVVLRLTDVTESKSIAMRFCCSCRVSFGNLSCSESNKFFLKGKFSAMLPHLLGLSSDEGLLETGLIRKITCLEASQRKEGHPEGVALV